MKYNFKSAKEILCSKKYWEERKKRITKFDIEQKKKPKGDSPKKLL